MVHTNIYISAAGYEQITAIHNAVPEFTTEEPAYFKNRCENADSLLLAAHHNDDPAGYMVAYDRYQDGSLYCWMTAVLPAYRQHGVLSAMMKNLEAHARSRNYKTIRIKTRNNRREMLHFLVKNGFEFTEVDKRAPLSDSRIHLVKTL